MANAWKPCGFTSVAPYLITRNAQQLIDFLGATLNATPLRRFDKPDGSIAHAEVRIDDTVVIMGEVGEESAAVPCHHRRLSRHRYPLGSVESARPTRSSRNAY